MARRNPWFELGMDAFALGVEAQAVVALRMMKFAAGGPAAASEATQMISEKLIAAAEIQAKVANGLLSGTSHLTPARTVAHYRRKVRANRRRLSKA